MIVGRLIILVGCFIMLLSGCSGSPAPETPESTVTYPFEGKNMFFGLSQVSPEEEQFARDLDISWLSLEPHVLWINIEQHIETDPGKYTWTSLDSEVARYQDLGIDFTMVISPAVNTFTEATRNAVFVRILAEMEEHNYSFISAFIHLMRDHDLAQEYDMGITTPERIEKFKAFVKAAVDRYDYDGTNDMPGLKYEARNWHFIEEWPSEYGGAQYVTLLKAIYPVIKEENHNAIVILPGLAGNYSQYFAFADGYIEDPDAGRMKNLGRVLTREQIKMTNMIKVEKPEYEYILKEGRGYFDRVDIHLYEPKETYMEGELDWLTAKMSEYGCSRPIWVIEGGGPFKNGPDDPNNPQGDPYYGLWTPKEGAEFVVKLLAMSAGKGVERQHWGLGTGEGGYWGGPWDVMGLLDFERSPKPAYFTYKLARERLRDFTAVNDLSFTTASPVESLVRLFEFSVPDNKKVYVAWNFEDEPISTDLSSTLGSMEVTVTSIVISLTGEGQPIGPMTTTRSSQEVPLSITPVFIEPVL